MKAMQYIWKSLPWVSFVLFCSSALLFFTVDNYAWIVTSLSSIYCLVLHRVLPKTGW